MEERRLAVHMNDLGARTRRMGLAACLFLAVMLLSAHPVNAQNKMYVFPHVADGVATDGSFYTSAIMVLPKTPGDTSITCVMNFHGLGVSLNGRLTSPFTTWTVIFSRNTYFLGITDANQALMTGYALLSCSDEVFAQLLYTYYSSSGKKLAEATVFASPAETGGASSYRMIADQQGMQMGIAIANDTSIERSYIVSDNTLSVVVTIPAKSQLARYVPELIPESANTIGILRIESMDHSPFYAIGLRTTGPMFTTVPAN